MRRKLTLAVLLTLSAASPQALALGVGEVDVRSSLNAPLRAVIPLTDTAGLDPERLRVSVADPREFESAGLLRTPLAASVRAEVEVRQGQWVVTLASERAVREPWMDLLLRFDWPEGRQLREVTLLLDPPDYDQMPVLVSGTSRQPASATTAPQPPAQTDAQPAVTQVSRPQQGSTAWVGSGDTLWSVAGRLRPDSGISMNQMMVALVEANPEVFPSGNINAMRAGHTLVVPSREAIAARSGADAERIVQAMNQAWANRGGGAPARVALGPTEAAGQNVEVAAAPDMAVETASAPDVEDQAQDTAASVADISAEPVQADESAPRLTLLSDEELAAESIESADQSEPAMAEDGTAPGSAGDMLDADVLATLGAGELAQAPADAPPVLLERRWLESQAALEEVQAERDALQQELGGLRDEVEAMREQLAMLLAGGGSGVDTAGVGGVVVQAEPETQVDPPWWGAMYPVAIDRNLVLGGAGLVALLGLWLLVRRRQRHDAAASMGSAAMPSMVHGMPPSSEMMPPGTPAAPVPAVAAGMTVADAETEERESQRPAMPQAEAISEVDIFMAYGRYDQARKLLETSLEREPERHDLRLKLLTVNVEQGRWREAEAVMQELAETGDPALMAEAARLMAKRHSLSVGAADEAAVAAPSAMSAPEGEASPIEQPENATAAKPDSARMDGRSREDASEPAEPADIVSSEGRGAPQQEKEADMTASSGTELGYASFSFDAPTQRGESQLPGSRPEALPLDGEPREEEQWEAVQLEEEQREEEPRQEEQRDEERSVEVKEAPQARPALTPQQGGASDWDVIDYQPPALDPAPAPRVETPMQPSIEFPHMQDEPSPGEEIDLPPLDGEATPDEEEWEVEEVAFPPLDRDNEPLQDEAARSEGLDEARRLLESGDVERARPLLQRLLDDPRQSHLHDDARALITHYRL